ncbi:hypothetical protein KEM48_005066 [Puccinia striiformis f. sp. tritici PST-130]|nr:hypothetical protein KEM48_005066 [Puccinia striiformis f. sp. tritici PST-130]
MGRFLNIQMRRKEDSDSEEDLSLAKIDRSDSDESTKERFKPDSIDNMATPEEVRIQIADAMAQMSVKFEEKLLEQNDQIIAQQREIYQFKQESAHNRQQPPHQQQQQVPAPYQHSRSEAKIRQSNGAVQKTHADRNTITPHCYTMGRTTRNGRKR